MDEHICQEIGMEFIPSDGQVQAVHQMISAILLPELVNVIINSARYWAHLHVKRQGKGTANVCLHSGMSATICYLVTPCIPPQARVHTVLFLIKSNNQGWFPPPPPDVPVLDSSGFRSAWSWFEAMIICQSDEYPNTPQWLKDAITWPVPVSGVSRDGAELTEQEKAAKDAVQIFDSEPSVFWLHDSEAKGNVDKNSPWGRQGLGKEFVHLLKPGDQIALLARAQAGRTA
ncbi:hypothetical protein Moror_15356 [Moniliophthora roreri MCA 2997]|uniref:Uncharacterized protein n=1 Tax=Moniliophthora roreri (strain MCA 2997) TaxID=1381753 RepID=V2WLR8_MONRO|nr:hypothetical protein Moror_15356 [Moniliophthora roreri MCA 2997]